MANPVNEWVSRLSVPLTVLVAFVVFKFGFTLPHVLLILGLFMAALMFLIVFTAPEFALPELYRVSFLLLGVTW